jgi:hypothetical protein
MRRRPLATLGALACGAGLLAGSASAETRLVAPNATNVATTSAGNVLLVVPDGANSAIEERSAAGALVRRVAVAGTIVDVDADAQGRLFVVDSVGSLARIEPDGQRGATRTLSGLRIGAVAVGTNGFVYVTTLRTGVNRVVGPPCRIARFSPDLQGASSPALVVWGECSVSPTLASAQSIGVVSFSTLPAPDIDLAPDGTVLVGDGINGRTLRFSADGAPLTPIPLPDDVGRPNLPIAVDPVSDGSEIWVAPNGVQNAEGNTPTPRLARLRSDGSAVAQIPIATGTSTSNYAPSVTPPYRLLNIRAMAVSGGVAYLVTSDLATAPQPVIALGPSPYADLGAQELSRTAVSRRVRLDAEDSWEPFGAITRYEWDFDGDGTFETDAGSVVTRDFPRAKSLTISVRVTGSATGQKVVGRVVLDANFTEPVPALAIRGLLIPPVIAGQTAVLDASGSTGIDNPASYAWDPNGDGTVDVTTDSPRLRYVFTRRGAVTPRVKITGPGGESTVASLPLRVLPRTPQGSVGVSILGARRNRSVALRLVWPNGANTAFISHSPRFSRARQVALSSRIPWRLGAPGSNRTSSVYVRFRGFEIDPLRTYRDVVSVRR